MNFNHTIIGAGLSGIVCLNKLITTIKNNKLKKNINICIIDKDYDLFCGGVAYSIKTSKSGFFNNPLRLSHQDYINWILKKKNLKIIKKYFNNSSSLSEKKWFKNYFKKLLKKQNISEIYMPRVSVHFWLKNLYNNSLKIIKEINASSKYKINLKIIISDIKVISKINNKFKIKVNKKYYFTDTLSLSLGLPPPEKFASLTNKFKNYMWDFYAEGSTEKLLQLIDSIKKTKVKIFFIGFKAGLLEPLIELKSLISQQKKKFFIFSSSMSKESLQPAKHSKNFKNYKFKFLTKQNILAVKTANQLYDIIRKELVDGPTQKFKKYDAWTKILNKNIIDEILKKLSKNEIKVYNNFYHKEIRNLTRFTYPEAIYAKNYLLKKNIIKIIEGSVKNIKLSKNQLIIEILKKNQKKLFIKSDIVVNVSGPKNFNSLETVLPIIKSLKKIAKNNSKGFLINHNFEICKNCYSPGVLSSGFNPARKTIFKAIIDNSKKVAIKIAKSYV